MLRAMINVLDICTLYVERSTTLALLIEPCVLYSIAKEVGPLSCIRRCFNGIVLIVEVINQIIQEYVKGVRRFDSLGVFIKHAHEQYDVMINASILTVLHKLFRLVMHYKSICRNCCVNN